MQLKPFEEWIKEGYQRDANLCGAGAHPTDERSLVRGDGTREYNQGSFVYFAKACGCWVFAGINGAKEWVECMWRVSLSLAALRRGPVARARQAVYSQNRDGYEVERCGRGGGGCVVWLHARVLCGCEAGCEVLGEHGAGSGEHEDKQSRCSAAARQS